MTGPIRCTASARYLSASEILLQDSGPIFTVDDARRLVVGVAAREFEAAGNRPVPAPKPRRQAAAEYDY